MKKIFYISILFCGSLVRLAAADSGKPQLEQPGIPAEIEKIFLDRLTDGKTLSLPQPIQKLPDENKVFDVWQGNRPYMRSSIDSVKLEFKKDPEGDDPGGAFSLDFEFAPDGFIIKHSNPQYDNEKAGLRVGNDKLNRPNSFFMRGKKKQSFAVFIPATAPSEKSRGALFCPRDFYSRGNREEKASLQNSGYVLNGATGIVRGEVNAYLRNPIDFVIAEAKILVTPGVLPAVNFYDRSYSKDASVALIYKPNEAEAPTAFSDFSNIALGMENFLSLHLSTGYKRLSRQQALFYTKAETISDTKQVVLYTRDVIGTELETELKLRKIPLNNQALISTKVQPGPCYLVLYRVLPIIHEYLKEDFVAPTE
jgi:hypothetical protein